MTSVRLEHVVKRYGPVVAAEIEHLDIADGEVVALLGPSGCGKTTTLRIVAGLITQDEGTLAFGDRDVTLVPPERRNAAMVFQNYALFPHMTVYQNIAFGLEVRKFSRDKIKERVRFGLGFGEATSDGGSPAEAAVWRATTTRRYRASSRDGARCSAVRRTAQ